jgi:hypothetical protein
MTSLTLYAWTTMNRFETWDRETLNKFAQDASDEIAALQEELRVALDAYRKLVVEHARKTD